MNLLCCFTLMSILSLLLTSNALAQSTSPAPTSGGNNGVNGQGPHDNPEYPPSRLGKRRPMFAGLVYYPSNKLQLTGDKKPKKHENEAANITYGLTLNQQLLFGAEIFALAVRYRSESRDKEVTSNFFQVGLGPTLIFFPLKDGPYLKGSFYIENLEKWQESTPGQKDAKQQYSGFGSGVGGGYALGIGKTFHINIELNIGYSKIYRSEVSVSSYATLGAGFYRY